MVTVPLGPIGGIAESSDQIRHGTYLLTECVEREGTSGQSRLQLILEDATGRITGFLWPERRPYIRLPTLPAAVAIQARVQHFNGKVQLKLHSLEPVDPEGVPSAAALLPRQRCLLRPTES